MSGSNDEIGKPTNDASQEDKTSISEAKSKNTTLTTADLSQLITSLPPNDIVNKETEILPVLGSMEQVLQYYISSNALSSTQINQLYDILSPSSSSSPPNITPDARELSPSYCGVAVNVNDEDDIDTAITAGKPTDTTNANPLSIDPAMLPKLERQATENVKKQQKLFIVYLNQRHDLWHLILSTPDRAIYAEKISKFVLYSRWSHLYIIFLSLLSMLCRWALPKLQVVPATMCIVWCVCFLLTYNVSMIKRMMRSFVFWYKIYNWVQFIVCYIILFNAPILSYEAANWVAGTVVITAVSMHDGLNWSYKFKIYIGFLVWIFLICIWIFVYFEGGSIASFFGAHLTFRNNVSIKFLGQEISVKSNALNAIFNLIVFIGNQLYLFIKSKGKKSTVLKINPRIVWCENEEAMKQKLTIALASPNLQAA